MGPDRWSHHPRAWSPADLLTSPPTGAVPGRGRRPVGVRASAQSSGPVACRAPRRRSHPNPSVPDARPAPRSGQRDQLIRLCKAVVLARSPTTAQGSCGTTSCKIEFRAAAWSTRSGQSRPIARFVRRLIGTPSPVLSLLTERICGADDAGCLNATVPVSGRAGGPVRGRRHDLVDRGARLVERWDPGRRLPHRGRPVGCSFRCVTTIPRPRTTRAGGVRHSRRREHPPRCTSPAWTWPSGVATVIGFKRQARQRGSRGSPGKCESRSR